MKTPALSLVALLGLLLPAQAAPGYSGFHASIRGLCVERQPDDGRRERGCANQFDADEDEALLMEAAGQSGDDDQAAIRNAAYLSAMKAVCGFPVSDMVEEYRQRAVRRGRFTDKQIDDGIKALRFGLTDQGRHHPKRFCTEAETSLPLFRTDLAKP